MITFLISQCIEEYNPDLNTNVDLLTIDGGIVRGQDEQIIIITRSTPVDNTQYKLVKNCIVIVTDDKGNTFPFKEIATGKYHAKLDVSYLDIGAKFKLSIKTDDNKEYESDYEEIPDCPPVDSLYFLEEINYSKELNKDWNGLRLNLDLPAEEGKTGYYRWKIDETWERRSYNSTIHFELVGIEPGENPTPILQNFNRPDSLHYCWLNDKITELFSTSTLNLEPNGKKRVPLHFVFENEKRLFYRYSCLVKQYSLTEGAYNYWHNKEIEIKESGGIYFSQPGQTISNIKNIDNDKEIVLGYFWTSSLQQKRFFYEGSYGHLPCQLDSFNIYDYCEGPDINGEYSQKPNILPVYLDFSISPGIDPNIPDTTLLTSDKYCFDCRLLGGSITKPDFW